MRRKSERNKAKGSPEKKIEKATRRTTRRRGKPSPSTSPERENAEDNVSSIPYSDDDKEIQLQTNDQVNDQEVEKGVSSSEVIKSVLGEDDENRSVWKVARADASPGEIQKLKLCRQRNISEASDSPLSRKISNKWPDSGEGGTEEADSADEHVASSQKAAIGEQADDTSSVHPGQDSNEEVSDYKENLSETTSANLSDDKTNIDQQADSKENLPVTSNLYEQPICEDNQSSSLSTDAPADGLQHQSPNSTDNIAKHCPANTEILPSDHQNEDIQEKSNEQTYVNSITETCNQPNDLVDNNITNDECINEAASADENIQTHTEETVDEQVDSCENQSSEELVSKENVVSEHENYPQQEQNTEGVSLNETAELDSVKNSESLQNEEDQREEGELVDEENEKEPSPDTDSNVRDESDTQDGNDRKSPVPESRSSHRKHGKYHESSASDTLESDEDIAKTKKIQKVEADSSNLQENNKSSRKSRRDSRKKKRNSEKNSISVSIDTEVELSESNLEKDDILEITEKSDDLSVSLSTSKPAKVSLKRSFSSRLSTDTEIKKEENHNKKPEVNESNQTKENHADNDQSDQKSSTKKRRWGMTTTSDNAPEFSISTDSLKALVPGAKPLSANEVRLTRDKDEDDEKEHKKTKNDTTGDYKLKADAVSKNDVSKKSEPKGDNHSTSRRKITVVKDTPRPTSPSLPEAQATNILLIRNLVRPFTLNQIKELLSRTGTIVENGFWMDRIKSKCFVEYANEDQAFETRQALHGVSWPPSNPKKLIVEYATKEDMELAREISKEQPIVRKTEPMLASDLWQQDQWSRDERPNVVNKITIIREWDLGKEDGQLHVKEKERERKEYEKKKRQRSRSPVIEAHLPAPARKFKKKEEEPPTAKLLDDLFRKTKSTPCIYWLPLTNEQILIKEEMRRQHMAEHARRLDEIRRVERSRDTRRRRSPRK